jgi:hypothetical protein
LSPSKDETPDSLYFNGVDTIATKVGYAVRERAGVMIWEVGYGLS